MRIDLRSCASPADVSCEYELRGHVDVAIFCSAQQEDPCAARESVDADAWPHVPTDGWEAGYADAPPEGFYTALGRLQEEDVGVAIVLVRERQMLQTRDFLYIALRAVLFRPVREWEVHTLLACCARERDRSRRNAYFPYGQRIEAVRSEDVVYVEHEDHRIRVHLLDGVELVSSMRMEEAERMLRRAGSAFLRIHKSYIVNLDHAWWAQREEVLIEQGRTLPVSRRYQKILRSYLQGLCGRAGEDGGRETKARKA